MENIAALLIPAVLGLILIRLLVLPVRWMLKFLLNGGCGFLCLWILGSISGLTGIAFPINPVTVLIAGFLGLPGIGLIALLG